MSAGATSRWIMDQGKDTGYDDKDAILVITEKSITFTLTDGSNWVSEDEVNYKLRLDDFYNHCFSRTRNKIMQFEAINCSFVWVAAPC